MPRPIKPPTYRRHKASGQAVVVVNKQTSYLGPWDSPESHAEYRRIVAEWSLGGTRPTAAERSAPTTGLTIAELIVAYMGHVASYYVKAGRPTSEPCTIRQAMKPLRVLYGHSAAVSFGPLALKAVRAEMVKSGWCRSYVNKQVCRVRNLFAWAVENELIAVAVHQALTTVKGLAKGRTEAREKPPIEPVTDDALTATLPFMPPIVAAMAQLQQFTAMRPQEVVSIRPASIDRSDPACWLCRPGRHKTQHHGRDRIIVIGSRAQAILAPFLGGEPDAPCFSPAESERTRNDARKAARKSPMTPEHRKRAAQARAEGRATGRYDRSSYRVAIRRACDKAFPHPTLGTVPRAALDEVQRAELQAWRKRHRWTPNQLRHLAATKIRQRHGLEGAQVILGHAEIGTTQIYAERDLAKAKAIMSEMG